jgi:mannose/fructose/N-acetylgalactosamine-specific phosphotransferase system component IID
MSFYYNRLIYNVGNKIIHTSNRNQLYIILSSCILGVIILSSLIVLLVSIIICRKYKKRKSLSTQLTHLPQLHLSEIKLVKANLKKVDNNFSATNAIFEK